MAERAAFIRWFVIACVTIAGLFILWELGIVADIWARDISCLSAVILGFFFVASGYLGLSSWRIDGEDPERAMKIGWFSGDLCMNLGMLGTVIGFVSLLSGFDGLNVLNSASIQKVFMGLGASAGTALYTTMVGLACSINLGIQTFNIDIARRRAP